MHDIRAIRANSLAFDDAMARRSIPFVATELVSLDAGLRQMLTGLQVCQARRKAIGREVGEAKRLGIESSQLEQEGADLRARIEVIEQAVQDQEKALRDKLAALPNILDPDVPDGPDESANLVLKQFGEPRTFAFAPREHFDLGEALGMMDFATAAKIAGSRFTILRGPLARLERALGQFMIDLHTTEHGYEETTVPLLVNDDAVFGTNNLPKFAEDLFRTTDGRWLIPTAEVSLTNMVAREILPDSRLPIRVSALTECFRSEAGSAGRDTRGMLRQHQFRKVEMVSIVRPDDSDSEHERMTRCAETVLERLGLAYRRVLLCSGDTGFGSARTHDLEVWLPGQKAWREISSCSNMRGFQARRMDARFRGSDGKIAHVHTLNGSGVAVGRALIAVMENYQCADGAITVPEVLRPYLAGQQQISR